MEHLRGGILGTCNALNSFQTATDKFKCTIFTYVNLIRNFALQHAVANYGNQLKYMYQQYKFKVLKLSNNIKLIH